MTTITTRTVSLSISAPPTLSEVIRGTVGPVKGTGSSVTFTIPDWVVEGDGMAFLMASRVDYSDADYEADNTVPVGFNSVTGWTKYTAFKSTAGHTPGFYYSTKILIAEMVTRAAGATEAGTEYTFTFHHDTETFYYFLIVFNGDYMLSDVIYNGDIDSAFHDIDGYQNVGVTNFYAPSLTLYSARPAVVLFGAIDGNLRTTPSFGWTEMCDIGDANVSLFVAAKTTTGTTGMIHAYMEDSDEYFASIAFETESI